MALAVRYSLVSVQPNARGTRFLSRYLSITNETWRCHIDEDVKVKLKRSASSSNSRRHYISICNISSTYNKKLFGTSSISSQKRYFSSTPELLTNQSVIQPLGEAEATSAPHPSSSLLSPAPDDASLLSAVAEAGDPSSPLSSVGLAGWSPPGLVEQLMEVFHVSGDLPWWGAIAATTLTLRLLTLPAAVAAQRHSTALANAAPQLQALQMKIQAASNSGDIYGAALYTEEMGKFMKKNNVSPWKGGLIPLVQMPVFMSMFCSLRRCAALPVASFATGGLLWFPDLTVADPTLVLPLLTSATMYLTLHLSLSAAPAPTGALKYVTVFLRTLPLLSLPFMVHFPSAVLVYWLSTNVCSLVQSTLLRQSRVRALLGVPPLRRHPPSSLPLSAQDWSPRQAAAQLYKTMEAMIEASERRRYDEAKAKGRKRSEWEAAREAANRRRSLEQAKGKRV